MDILNNIEWYFDVPTNAVMRDTRKHLTTEQLNTIVFDDSKEDNVTFCLPLNEHFIFSKTKELPRPINVRQILYLIYNFYNSPLNAECFESAFENNEEWLEELIYRYDGDTTEIKNVDVFVDINCAPDFSGLIFDEKSNEYFVGIGPE